MGSGGQIRQRPSGRWEGRFYGADGRRQTSTAPRGAKPKSGCGLRSWPPTTASSQSPDGGTNGGTPGIKTALGTLFEGRFTFKSVVSPEGLEPSTR
jgi:hypothetical protein